MFATAEATAIRPFRIEVPEEQLAELRRRIAVRAGLTESQRREELEMSSTVQQVPGITRTDLLRADLSVPGREVIQNRVQIGPEAPFVRRKHPGEEIIYVLEGSLEYHVDGNEPKTVNAGGSLVVPPETVHAVRNVGNGKAAELATYVVEKGKPFLVVVD